MNHKSRELRSILQLPAAVTVSVALAAVPASAQRDLSAVEIEAQHVAGNVHMLTGAGGNIGVSAGEDGILFIDDQFEPLADKIRAAIGEIDPGPLEFLINTHFHGDHTGSNAAFGDEAHIVAHENVRVRLANPAQGEPAPDVALPVITYDDGLSIHFNGERVRVTHLPTGHTDGDSWIHFEDSGVAHLGDHFFVDRFPYVDVGAGGNALGFLENIGTLLEALPDDVQIIPGHGPLADKEDLERFHAMLEATIATVRDAKDAGRSLEEVQDAGFDEKYAEWGSGFINSDRWAQIVWASLE